MQFEETLRFEELLIRDSKYMSNRHEQRKNWTTRRLKVPYYIFTLDQFNPVISNNLHIVRLSVTHCTSFTRIQSNPVVCNILHIIHSHPILPGYLDRNLCVFLLDLLGSFIPYLVISGESALKDFNQPSAARNWILLSISALPSVKLLLFLLFIQFRTLSFLLFFLPSFLYLFHLRHLSIYA